MSSFVRRLFFNAVPFGIMAVVVCLAIFGEHGLIRRHYLRAQQVEVSSQISSLERENTALRRKLEILDSRELGLRRLAAEEMMMAPEGSTIYRFSSARQ